MASSATTSLIQDALMTQAPNRSSRQSEKPMGVMQDIRKIRPPIRAVLFDLDNTLVHRGESIERYAKRFLQDFSDSLTSVSRHTVARLVKRQDNGGYLPIGSPFATVRAAVVHSLAYELPWHRGVQERKSLLIGPTAFQSALSRWKVPVRSANDWQRSACAWASCQMAPRSRDGQPLRNSPLQASSHPF